MYAKQHNEAGEMEAFSSLKKLKKSLLSNIQAISDFYGTRRIL